MAATTYDFDYSRKYYFGPGAEFNSKDSALAHAKYKESCMKEHWDWRFKSSKILEGANFYQVEVKYILREE